MALKYIIKEQTIVDAIFDRILHFAYPIENERRILEKVKMSNRNIQQILF